MKQIFVAVLMVISIQALGQCGLVSGTKNKDSGVITDGGVVNSKDFYSLLNSKGEFRLLLSDNILEILSKTPIFKIKVFEILETGFSPRVQKQQMKIATCLLKKE